MIENSICLTISLLGFIVAFLIGIGYKTNRNTNFYLLLIITLSSVRFLSHSTYFSFFSNTYQKQIDFIYIVTATPLTYLYFINLTRNNIALKKEDLLHFILPIILLFLNNYITKYELIKGVKIGFFVLIIFNIIYITASFIFLRKNVWKRESNIFLINQQNTIVKNWTKLLFSFYLLMIFRFILNLSLNESALWYLNKNNLMWMGGLIWILLYIKILFTPEFLYGYEIFQNKIKEYKKHNVIFDNVWKIQANVEIINIQDSVLKVKVETNLKNYIQEIEYLALNNSLFYSKNFTILILSNKLNIPNSHLIYLFKYHSKLSFSDFKKIIRIQKSVLLINEGFLKKNTFESLATETGFSSYSVFF